MKCKLCNKKINKYGHSGYPLVDGMVCNVCNKKVINSRLDKLV